MWIGRSKGSHTSITLFSKVLYPGEIGIGNVDFVEGRTPEKSEKPSELDENHQQTQSAYCTGPESNPGRSHAPLRHPCFNTCLHLIPFNTCPQSHAARVMCMQLFFMPGDKDRYYTFTVRFRAFYRLQHDVRVTWFPFDVSSCNRGFQVWFLVASTPWWPGL